MNENEISGVQIRAARACLNWTLKDLEKYSGVATSSLQRIEASEGTPAAKDTGVPQTYEHRAAALAESLGKIVETLKGAGITFLPDTGRGIGIRYKAPAKRR